MMNTSNTLPTDDLASFVKDFKKKFKKVTEKMPLPIEFKCDIDSLKLWDSQGQPLKYYPWKQVYNDYVAEAAGEESAVGTFIHDIKYDIASTGILPVIKYRRLSERELSTDEAISTLLKSKSGIDDSDMYVSEVTEEKPFVVYEIDIRRGAVTLLNENEKLLFKHPLTSVFKHKIQKGDSPEDLGYFFFKRATLLRKL